MCYLTNTIYYTYTIMISFNIFHKRYKKNCIFTGRFRVQISSETNVDFSLFAQQFQLYSYILNIIQERLNLL